MTTNVLQTILLFGLGLILICLGGDKLVDAAVAIARKLGIPQIVVGATIVSLGTTLPEILVSTTAAFQGSAAIAAGNAFGSVICNTALIAGLTQTIRPMDKVETRSVGWRAAFFFATIAIADIVGLLTGAFNRVFGAILLLTFAVYAWLNIRWASGEGEEGESGEEDGSLLKQFAILGVCAAMLYFGANLLVDNGIILAQLMGVPERVIAVTFIALGTSLPELVTSVVPSWWMCRWAFWSWQCSSSPFCCGRRRPACREYCFWPFMGHIAGSASPKMQNILQTSSK